MALHGRKQKNWALHLTAGAGLLPETLSLTVAPAAGELVVRLIEGTIMEPMWLDRELVDQTVAGIDDRLLKYDPDTGQYCLHGEPFTGVAKTRRPSGLLDGLTHLKDGVEQGVSVAWYPNGQIRCYSEMADDVYDGWHFEWDEGGTKRIEERYSEGRKLV